MKHQSKNGQQKEKEQNRFAMKTILGQKVSLKVAPLKSGGQVIGQLLSKDQITLNLKELSKIAQLRSICQEKGQQL